MSVFWTIAEQALRQTMAGSRPAISAPGRLGLLAAASFMGLAGMGFALAASYMALDAVLTPALAALCTAAIAFTMAGILIGISEIVRYYRRRRGAVQMASLNDAIASMARELEDPIKTYPLSAVTVATLAGMMAGQRFH